MPSRFNFTPIRGIQSNVRDTLAAGELFGKATKGIADVLGDLDTRKRNESEAAFNAKLLGATSADEVNLLKQQFSQDAFGLNTSNLDAGKTAGAFDARISELDSNRIKGLENTLREDKATNALSNLAVNEQISDKQSAATLGGLVTAENLRNELSTFNALSPEAKILAKPNLSRPAQDSVTSSETASIKLREDAAIATSTENRRLFNDTADAVVLGLVDDRGLTDVKALKTQLTSSGLNPTLINERVRAVRNENQQTSKNSYDSFVTANNFADLNEDRETKKTVIKYREFAEKSTDSEGNFNLSKFKEFTKNNRNFEAYARVAGELGATIAVDEKYAQALESAKTRRLPGALNEAIQNPANIGADGSTNLANVQTQLQDAGYTELESITAIQQWQAVQDGISSRITSQRMAAFRDLDESYKPAIDTLPGNEKTIALSARALIRKAFSDEKVHTALLSTDAGRNALNSLSADMHEAFGTNHNLTSDNTAEFYSGRIPLLDLVSTLTKLKLAPSKKSSLVDKQGDRPSNVSSDKSITQTVDNAIANLQSRDQQVNTGPVIGNNKGKALRLDQLISAPEINLSEVAKKLNTTTGPTQNFLNDLSKRFNKLVN